MPLKNVVLVASDPAPVQALSKLAEQEWPDSVKVHTLFDDNNDKMLSDIMNTGKVHFVLTGMSFKPEAARAELSACAMAKNMGIPYGLYADTYGVATRRPHFDDLKESVQALFVINEKEAESARKIFPNAKIVASGNPMWEDFHFPETTYTEVRIERRISPETFAILVPGGKELVINILHFGSVIEAVAKCMPWNVSLCISLHPKDPNPPEVYEKLAEYAPMPVHILTKSDIPSSRLLVGCDVVVGSMSTIGIEAACQRKPVIEFLTTLALQRQKRETWDICEEGAAFAVYGDTGALSDAITDFSFGDSIRANQKASQEKIFPRPEKRGVSVGEMQNTVLSFLR